MQYETILYEASPDRVATLTLNRPEAMNAFNQRMLDEFKDAWHRINYDDAIHAIVLRAAPGRAFCTGVDVKQGYDYSSQPIPWLRRDPGEWLGPKQNKLWKPVVCAVHGLAAGGAFYWINECDIVICSEDAQFFDPHVTFGMTSACEPVGLSRRVPLGEVLRITLMGNDERVGAETALRIGLVSEIVPNDQLWKRAHEIAAIIAAKPAAATQGSVRAIWDSLDMGLRAAQNWAMPYTQLGNPAGVAEVQRSSVPKVKPRIR
jgi:enoyl-CoA hydratase/carnithine racemase